MASLHLPSHSVMNVMFKLKDLDFSEEYLQEVFHPLFRVQNLKKLLFFRNLHEQMG